MDVRKLLPETVVQNLGLTLTDMSVGSSFIRGCVFYKTQTDGVYLTNWDVRADEDVRDPDLSKADLWMLYGRIGNYHDTMKVSGELLKDNLAAKFAIDDFVRQLNSGALKKP